MMSVDSFIKYTLCVLLALAILAMSIALVVYRVEAYALVKACIEAFILLAKSYKLTSVVFTSALLATGVASMMGTEQDQRLKNGTFGTLAGTSVGAFAGLLSNNPKLLIVGFLGSTIGACGGYLAYLGLSYLASRPLGRRWLEFQVSGLQGLRDQLRLDDQQVVISALTEWRHRFDQMMQKGKQQLLVASDKKKDILDAPRRLVIETWLRTAIDILALVFATLAKKPQYESRVTLIVYGKDSNGEIVGRHWLSYSGRLLDHTRSKKFSQDSVGYHVLTGDKPSPYFTTSATSDALKTEKGEYRGEKSARPFMTFKVNGCTILALDWPPPADDVDVKDPYVKLARELFDVDIVPAISDLLESWPEESWRNQIMTELCFTPLPRSEASN